MARRTCFGILLATLCWTTLPACAPTTQTVLPAQDHAQTSQARQENGATEESEIKPPARPPLDGNSRGQAEPAPGYRVPEYLKPPPVLAPLPPLRMAPLPADQTGDPIPPVVAATPAAVNDHDLVNALRMLLNKQPDKALPYLEHYDRATQELFIRLLPTLVLLSEKPFDQLNPTEVGALQDQLQGLLVTLRTRSELTISKLSLCEKIEGYGQITPRRNGNVFQPGDMVLVYVELCNTSCELRNGYYVTDFNGIASIHDARGQEVVHHDFRVDGVHAQTMRSLLPHYDCWRPYVFYLSSAMPPGNYVLTLEMTDETRPAQKRVARKAVEFVVR